MTFERDNQLSSCTGDTSDSTGEIANFYVEFSSDTEMNIYGNASGGSVLGSMSKGGEEATDTKLRRFLIGFIINWIYSY